MASSASDAIGASRIPKPRPVRRVGFFRLRARSTSRFGFAHPSDARSYSPDASALHAPAIHPNPLIR